MLIFYGKVAVLLFPSEVGGKHDVAQQIQQPDHRLLIRLEPPRRTAQRLPLLRVGGQIFGQLSDFFFHFHSISPPAPCLSPGVRRVKMMCHLYALEACAYSRYKTIAASW